MKIILLLPPLICQSLQLEEREDFEQGEAIMLTCNCLWEDIIS